jgi:hypothetical protein
VARPVKKRDDILALIKSKDIGVGVENAQNQIHTLNFALALLEYRRGQFQRARDLMETVDAGAIRSNLLQHARPELADLGRHDMSGRALEGANANDPKSQRRLEASKFLKRAYDLYDRYGQMHSQKDPSGYVVLFDIGHRVTTGMMVPIAKSLLAQGYEVCSVMASSMPISESRTTCRRGARWRGTAS